MGTYTEVFSILICYAAWVTGMGVLPDFLLELQHELTFLIGIGFGECCLISD